MIWKQRSSGYSMGYSNLETKMVKKILIYPDPFLRKPTESIGGIYCGSRKDYEDNLDILRKALVNSGDGVALAANQIGLSWHTFAISKTNKDLNFIIKKYGDIFSDANYTPLGDEKEIQEEGCLSFPGIRLPIERWKKIKIKAHDQIYGKVEFELEDFPARVFQHEIDHLDGILFVDDLPIKKRLQIAKLLQKRK